MKRTLEQSMKDAMDKIKIEHELTKTCWRVIVRTIYLTKAGIRQEQFIEWRTTNEEAVAYAKEIGANIYGDDGFTKIMVLPPTELTTKEK